MFYRDRFQTLLCEILKMMVGAIASFGVYVAIAVVRNFGDEGCCEPIPLLFVSLSHKQDREYQN